MTVLTMVVVRVQRGRYALAEAIKSAFQPRFHGRNGNGMKLMVVA
jgi:hypothetical protein